MILNSLKTFFWNFTSTTLKISLQTAQTPYCWSQCSSKTNFYLYFWSLFSNSSVEVTCLLLTSYRWLYWLWLLLKMLFSHTVPLLFPYWNAHGVPNWQLRIINGGRPQKIGKVPWTVTEVININSFRENGVQKSKCTEYRTTEVNRARECTQIHQYPGELPGPHMGGLTGFHTGVAAHHQLQIHSSATLFLKRSPCTPSLVTKGV